MFLRRATDSHPFADIAFLQHVPRRAMRAVREETVWYCLPAGQALFQSGDPADRLYFLVSGSLGVFNGQTATNTKFSGQIKPGEPVGEMALFLGGVDLTGDGQPNNATHRNSVYAMRDCELVSISRKGFARLVQSQPDLLESLMRLVLGRLSEPPSSRKKSEPRVYTIILTSPNIDTAGYLAKLQEALESLGNTVGIIHQKDGLHKSADYFDRLERDCDIVLLITKSGDDAWFRKAMRQADRVWVLARSDARPSSPLIPESGSPVQALKLVDIVLLEAGEATRKISAEAWRVAAGASRIFHWRQSGPASANYLARVMAGHSVGLVLSGGGARAYAHIGGVRALREANIQIDFAGGTSMGAVVAACVAMGWDDDEIDRRIRESFVKTNPLGDFTLPIISLVKGTHVDQHLRKQFGATQIGDLKIPFFAISTDLNSGKEFRHDAGSLADALRATIALPGVLPPLVRDNRILVDGAITNNFPAETMANLHAGKTIGIDVARDENTLDISEFVIVPNSIKWVMKNGLRAMPPIVSLLMRAATFSHDLKSGHKYADIVVEPELGDIELRDWKAYDTAVEAGYKAMKSAIEANFSV